MRGWPRPKAIHVEVAAATAGVKQSQAHKLNLLSKPRPGLSCFFYTRAERLLLGERGMNGSTYDATDGNTRELSDRLDLSIYQ
jgi:hypothetical protein